jgi:hypothetical protein
MNFGKLKTIAILWTKPCQFGVYLKTLDGMHPILDSDSKRPKRLDDLDKTVPIRSLFENFGRHASNS